MGARRQAEVCQRRGELVRERVAARGPAASRGCPTASRRRVWASPRWPLGQMVLTFTSAARQSRSELFDGRSGRTDLESPRHGPRRRNRRCRCRRRGDRTRADSLRAGRHAARGRPGRGRRHEQGEHGAAAHGLRRQAGHAGVASGRARPPAAVGVRADAPASRSSAPALCSWPGTSSSAASSPGSSSARGPTATTRSASSTATSCTGASRASGRARWPRSRCPTRGSSARSPRRWRSRPRPCWPAASCAAARP